MSYHVNTVVWEFEEDSDKELEALLNKEEERGYVLDQLYTLPVPSKKEPTVVVITIKSLTTRTSEVLHQAADQVKTAGTNAAEFVTRHATAAKDVVQRAIDKVRDGEGEDKDEDATV